LWDLRFENCGEPTLANIPIEATVSYLFSNGTQCKREASQVVTLDWSRADSEGSCFSRGKHDYYAIIVQGIPEDNPRDCVIELYVTDKEMTASEIKISADRGQLKPISRSIVSWSSPPLTKINQSVESMKMTAENRENAMSTLSF
jgi:hypothetical protein